MRRMSWGPRNQSFWFGRNEAQLPCVKVDSCSCLFPECPHRDSPQMKRLGATSSHHPSSRYPPHTPFLSFASDMQRVLICTLEASRPSQTVAVSLDHLLRWLANSFWITPYLCNITTVPITQAIISCLLQSIRVLRLDWFLTGPSSAVAIHSRKKHDEHLFTVSFENLEMFLQLPRDHQHRGRRESFWLPVLASEPDPSARPVLGSIGTGSVECHRAFCRIQGICAGLEIWLMSHAHHLSIQETWAGIRLNHRLRCVGSAEEGLLNCGCFVGRGMIVAPEKRGR